VRWCRRTCQTNTFCRQLYYHTIDHRYLVYYVIYKYIYIYIRNIVDSRLESRALYFNIIIISLIIPQRPAWFKSGEKPFVMAASNEEDFEKGKKLMTCSNSLIVRFCVYGLLKNMKFFEPFLVRILITWGLNLAQIGLLISVEKITTYVMELPSGYVSDKFGAKSTLCSCFLIYIASFICYYFGEHQMPFLILASFLYGLAEAARSGAHKSMVFLWLERQKLLSFKSYLNGKTRSFSLLGSAVAAIAGIFFALYFEADKTIFLCSIPPYVLDFCIVASYPSYMNTNLSNQTELKKKKQKKGKSGGFIHDMKSLANVMRVPSQRRVVLTTASCGIFHRVFKDFVQPVVVANGHTIFPMFPIDKSNINSEMNNTVNINSTVPSPSISSAASDASSSSSTEIIILGIAYFFFYIISSPASRNAYRLPALLRSKEKNVMDLLLDGYALILLFISIALFMSAPMLAPFLYIFLYVIYNFAKPLSASAVSDVAGKRLRATVFSADAALQTFITAAFAPLAGFLGDNLSLASAFFSFGFFLLILNRVFFAEISLVEKICHSTITMHTTTPKEKVRDLDEKNEYTLEEKQEEIVEDHHESSFDIEI
jgi:MFS family permease